MFGLEEGRLRWCASQTGFVPTDRWLYTVLNTERCVVLGTIDTVSADETSWTAAQAVAAGVRSGGCSILSWLAYVDEEEMRRSGSADAAAEVMGKFLWELAREGISAIALLAQSIHVLVSPSRFIDIDALTNDKATILEDVSQDIESASNESGEPKPEIRATRASVLLQWGNPAASSFNLKSALNALQAALPQSQRRRYSPSVLFVAELQTPHTEELPETLIAQVWKESLGPTAIPFDLADRQALIERGRQHPELQRHIEAWERMSREACVPE